MSDGSGSGPGPGPSPDLGPGESPFTFPAAMSLKAIGEHREIDGIGLQALVESIVRPLLEPDAPERVETVPSSGGKYVSVRVHFTATSRAQLEALYGALHAEPRVLQTL